MKLVKYKIQLVKTYPELRGTNGNTKIILHKTPNLGVV